jgi:hypothetical protein
MTDDQKKACRALFDLSFDSGFGLFPVALISEKTGIPVDQLSLSGYEDDEHEKGILWLFHPAAKGDLAGFLYFNGHGPKTSVGISMDTRDILAHWSDYRG